MRRFFFLCSIFVPYSMMKKESIFNRMLIVTCALSLVLSVSLPLRVLGADDALCKSSSKNSLEDFILTNVLSNVSRYSDVVHSYQAQLYVRGQYHVHHRNLLIRLVPDMFRFYRDVSDYMTESVSDLSYTSPDIYEMKMRALTGTFRRNKSGIRNTLDFFTLNVYSATLLPEMLISPLAPGAQSHYTYLLDSLSGDKDSLQYHIRIIPRRRSTQLLQGSMVVNDSTWTIDRITLEGRVELLDFKIHMQMGKQGAAVFLPQRVEMSTMFRFLWNKIEGDYVAHLEYRDIALRNEAGTLSPEAQEAGTRDKYDLTSAFSLQGDEGGVSTDTAYVSARRPEPLTPLQQKIYDDYYSGREQTARLMPVGRQKNQLFWGSVGDALVSSHTLSLPSKGHFRFSPLIDLGMFSYSHSNGFSYKQRFNYTHLFSRDRWLRVQPMAGYNFKRKEFYWDVDMNFYYAPRRLGALTFEVGNGNRIYTSRVMDEMRQWGDSLVDFSKLHLEYFKDMYVRLGNQIEVTNGLLLQTSLDMHWRRAMNASVLQMQGGQQPVKAVYLRPTYVSFAPRVKLSWTPGQYYYMNGSRKVYLHSRFPTFSLDYERGLDGVLGSNGAFERIEVDVQQRIRLSGISSLYYRYGGGVFTDQEAVYFVDFANFTRSNLPMGWSDEISGSFHLLDNDWYNSSRWYSRAHLTYEAPFILLPHSRKFTGVVHSERLYLSALYTTQLRPYLEVGYGIGTYLFNLGFFASNVNGQFHEVGCKFTFELFSGR